MKNLEFMYFELPLQSQAIHYGSLAQLVQSVCLTSRGSGVRIPQLPQLKINDLQQCRSFFFYVPPWSVYTFFARLC